jgi:hypothetical protein
MTTKFKKKSHKPNFKTKPRESYFKYINESNLIDMYNDFILDSNILDNGIVNDQCIISRFIRDFNYGNSDNDTLRLIKDKIHSLAISNMDLLHELSQSANIMDMKGLNLTKTSLYMKLFDMGYEVPSFKAVDKLFSKLKLNLIDDIKSNKNTNLMIDNIDIAVKDYLSTHKAHALLTFIDTSSKFHYFEFAISDENFDNADHDFDSKTKIIIKKALKHLHLSDCGILNFTIYRMGKGVFRKKIIENSFCHRLV